MAALGAAALLTMTGGPSAAQETTTDAAKPAAAPAAAGDEAARLAKGKELFANYGCGGCHTLAAAGATGDVGPALDGDSNLSKSFILDRLNNGQGAMPSFAGQMSDTEMGDLADYVLHASHK